MAPKKSKGGFYAVRVGRKPGVYTTWPEAEAQVKGFIGCVHKKFATKGEAEAFAQPLGASGASAAPSPTGKGRARDEEGASHKPPPAKRARTSGGGDKVFVKEGRRVYSDGSSRGNGQKGAVAGIGVFWSHDIGAPNLSERLPGLPQTNNRAELYAVARILETDPTPESPLTICTDSQYTIDVFSTWIPNWIRRDWMTADGKPVVNKDLIVYIVSLLKLRTPADSSSRTGNITFQKVRAHVGIEGNEMADKLANNGALLEVKDPVDFAALTRANEKLLTAKGKANVKPLFEVDEGDLWTDEEMREMEQSQEF